MLLKERRGEIMKNRQHSRFVGLALLLACGLVLVCPAPVRAASNAFLRISGIKGESTDQAHKDWIIIESFSFGIGKTSPTRGIGDITITKVVDKASPSLLEYANKGSNFSEATFDFKRVDGNPGFVSYTLKNVGIVSRTLSANGKTETLKLAYQSAQQNRL
jgi:type VI secretion system secreted protein Hcp